MELLYRPTARREVGPMHIGLYPLAMYDLLYHSAGQGRDEGHPTMPRYTLLYISIDNTVDDRVSHSLIHPGPRFNR